MKRKEEEKKKRLVNEVNRAISQLAGKQVREGTRAGRLAVEIVAGEIRRRDVTQVAAGELSLYQDAPVTSGSGNPGSWEPARKPPGT